MPATTLSLWDQVATLATEVDEDGALGSPLQLNPPTLLTFKEDEPPVMPLVGSIDVPGEAPPEVPDGHGVVIQHPVVPDPPEPPALVGNGVLAEDGGTQSQ